MPRPAGSLVAIVLSLGLVAACGATPASTPSPEFGGDLGTVPPDDGTADLGFPTVIATLTMRGAAEFSGTFERLGVNPGQTSQTCQLFAAGYKEVEDRTVFDLPLTSGANTGRDVVATGRVGEYRGPGEYGRDEVSSSFSIDGIPYDFDYLDGSTEKVTVRSDGSGSYEFTDIGRTDVPTADRPTISGSLTWTCKDPSR